MVTLTHLLLFANVPIALKVRLTGITFVSAVADELAGWLVRFVHPAFAYFKIGAFLSLELSLAALLILVGASLLIQRSTQKQRNGNFPVPQSAHGDQLRG